MQSDHAKLCFSRTHCSGHGTWLQFSSRYKTADLSRVFRSVLYTNSRAHDTHTNTYMARALLVVQVRLSKFKSRHNGAVEKHCSSSLCLERTRRQFFEWLRHEGERVHVYTYAHNIRIMCARTYVSVKEVTKKSTKRKKAARTRHPHSFQDTHEARVVPIQKNPHDAGASSGVQSGISQFYLSVKHRNAMNINENT